MNSMNPAPKRDVLDAIVKFRDEAVDALGQESVPVYLFITDRFTSTSDVSSDFVFQFVFRSYYRLDNAGLGDDFKKRYFQLLQQHRTCPRPDLRRLCEELAPYETKKGKQSLQFSFATKLLVLGFTSSSVYRKVWESLEETRFFPVFDRDCST